MPWLRIPFTQEERRRKLARALDVQAIPTLVILDPRDNIITLDGRAELIEDPEGLVFATYIFLITTLHQEISDGSEENTRNKNYSLQNAFSSSSFFTIVNCIVDFIAIF